jgi:hypothetical protein
MSKSIKRIWAELRMIVVYELCSLALSIAPNTPEGNAFVASMASTARAARSLGYSRIKARKGRATRA